MVHGTATIREFVRGRARAATALAASLAAWPGTCLAQSASAGIAADLGQHPIFGDHSGAHLGMMLATVGGVLLVAILGLNFVSRAARRAIAEKTRALQESETRLAAAQQIGQIGHWTLEIASGSFTCSDELYRIYGLEIGAPLSLDAITAPIHEEDWPKARENREAAIAAKRGYEFSFRIRRPDGAVRHVEGKTDVILDERGAVTGFFGITQDVTERRQATEALRLTQFALDNAADAVLWIGSDGRIEYVNRAAHRLLGYAPDALLRLHIWDIDPAVCEADWPSIWNRVIGRGDHSFEAVHVTSDGTRVPVEVSTSAVRFGGREILCSFSRDISPRKAAEAALRKREGQLRRVIDSLPVLINYLDAERRYVLVNKTATEWYARPEEEIIGKRPEDVFGDLEPVWRGKQMQALCGEAVTEEWTLPYPDGTTRTVRSHLVPDIGEDGKVHGLFSLSEDITRNRQVEEQLRNSQKLEAIGQVAGGVAHEFNNLLMAITGNLELLLEGRIQDTENVRGQLETVLKSAFRGKDLTGRLLSYAGSAFDRPEVVDVAEAVAGIRRFLGPALGETVEIRTTVSRGLWPVRVDPSELENALTNLAINARDAMPGGGIITIACANAVLDDDFAAARPYAVRTGDSVRVSVSDTGTGMPPDVVARAFDPFFTTKEVGQGTGLGLSMVYGFVTRQSDGYLEIETAVGRGTTVTMYFPRSEAAAEPVRADNVVRIAPPRRRVLLVEDSSDVREMLANVLRSANYAVTAAATAAAALDLLGPSRRIDLLVTDVVLPGGLSGVDRAERVRATMPDLPVVLISGYAESELAARGVPEGRYPLLGKPFRKADLLAVLDRVFAGDGGGEVRELGKE
jgi:PAS domain S-box-containing protein